MSTTCLACQGSAADTFICGVCTSQLRKLLDDLPWWLRILEEAAVGDVRLGDTGSGRSRTRASQIHGDDQALTKCECGHGEHEGIACRVVQVDTVTSPVLDDDGEPVLDDEGRPVVQMIIRQRMCNCDVYKPAVKVAKLRARLLAQGGVNARASDLLDVVTNEVSTTVRHVGESRSLVFVDPRFIGPLLANHVRCGATPTDLVNFLRSNIGAIACDESAGEFLHALRQHCKSIESVVNRPVELKTCGPCPQVLTEEACGDDCKEAHPHPCGMELLAQPDEAYVTCPKCKVSQSVADLVRDLFARADAMLYTVRELVDTVLPKLEIVISERSIERWAEVGALLERGRTLDGKGKEVPQYVLADVKRVRDEMAERRAKGYKNRGMKKVG